MEQLISTFLLVFSLSTAMAQEAELVRTRTSADDYIQTYATLAVQEMYYSGIPASITLAQGLLESGCGNSRLSTEGNNHFGIKCKDYWTSDTLMVLDDDYNADKELIASCFRAYASPSLSYRDHSDFLRSNVRYANLFTLDQEDYSGWALGLQQCGYATNPQYANLLSALIERYALDVFDRVPEQEIASCLDYYETHKYIDSHKRATAGELVSNNQPKAVRLPGFYKAGWLKANRRQALITGLIDQGSADVVTASTNKDDSFLEFEVTTAPK
ncbi:MAG: glucosaminidase domain-containing protein [Saprospiraceae bacterium]|nr:glucosaminidase domain-containing protein [Saprospiraceae bacterium]